MVDGSCLDIDILKRNEVIADTRNYKKEDPINARKLAFWDYS